jgi:biopolymer transport protein ExbB
LVPLTVAVVVYGQGEKAPAAPTTAAAPEAGAGQPGPTQEQAPQQVTFIQMLRWAGIVGYTLVALSIATLALLFKHVFALRREALMPRRIIEGVEQFIAQKKIKEAIEFCKADESTLAKMLAAGLGELRHGYEDAVSIMGEVGEDEIIKHNTGISLFGMIANVGPMLGLLGTVSGMVTTFNKIATAVGAVKPGQLAEGIQEALVNTVLGLAVAIPNVCVFTLLKNRVTRMFLQMGVVTEEIISPLKGLRVVQGPGAPGVAGIGPLPSATRAAGVAPVPGSVRPSAPPTATTQP